MTGRLLRLLSDSPRFGLRFPRAAPRASASQPLGACSGAEQRTWQGQPGGTIATGTRSTRVQLPSELRFRRERRAFPSRLIALGTARNHWQGFQWWRAHRCESMVVFAAVARQRCGRAKVIGPDAPGKTRQEDEPQKTKRPACDADRALSSLL